MYFIQYRDKNCIIINAGSGLQCFECNVENDHICSETGVQNGQIIDCSKDETACSKYVGGKIFGAILVSYHKSTSLFDRYGFISIFWFVFQNF